MDRVQTIAPFLTYDEDPYIVTVDGKLYWIIDAYTTSSYYPYSEPFAENTSVNYICNSIKVIIDAYKMCIRDRCWRALICSTAKS